MEVNTTETNTADDTSRRGAQECEIDRQICLLLQTDTNGRVPCLCLLKYLEFDVVNKRPENFLKNWKVNTKKLQIQAVHLTIF